MPVILTPALREAFINITVTTPHDESLPATIIPAAGRHDEIAATVEAALEEYQHLADNETWVAAAKRLSTYFTANGAGDFYAVRSLVPAGSIVEVDADSLLDVMRIRFALVFAVLPASLQADPRTGKAYARHFQSALKGLLVTGWSLSPVFIPGDKDRRPGDRTEIDVMLEMGAAQGRLRHEQFPG